MESFKDKDGLIYASGHEHSLQFIPHLEEKNRQSYLVSGFGSVTSYVKKRSANIFTYQGKGFIALHYYKDRSNKVEFWDQEGIRVNRRIIKPDDSFKSANRNH